MKKETNSKTLEETNSRIFNQRLDFYGQSLAAYVIVLFMFLIFYGTLEDGGTFKLKVFTPIIILMLAIVVITVILLIIATIKRKRIIISDNSITFQNRAFSRRFEHDDIQRIKINRSLSEVVKEDASFVRIKFKNKKKSILVRTASFDKDKELLGCFVEINNKIKKQHN